MKRKVTKSIQAIIATILVGAIIPSLFSLTENSIFDKLAWKVALSGMFFIATLLVGVLFSTKIINSRVVGGKARIFIYIILVAVVCTAGMPFMVALSQSIKWLTYLLIALLSCAVILGLIYFAHKSINLFSGNNIYHKTVEVQNISNILKQDRALKFNTDIGSMNRFQRSSCLNIIAEHVATPKLISEKNTEEVGTQVCKVKEDIIRNTIFALWANKDKSFKCLTVYNNENPDLSWIKIYKAPYPNGKIYGYIKMKNARDTKSGEIYFADMPIWYVA